MICEIPSVYLVGVDPLVKWCQKCHIHIAVASVPGKLRAAFYGGDVWLSVLVNVSVYFDSVKHQIRDRLVYKIIPAFDGIGGRLDHNSRIVSGLGA